MFETYLHTLILILDSTVRLSTPLLLACLAGLYSERSGIVDIGLEGKMLGAAFGAGAVGYMTGNAWLGLLVVSSGRPDTSLAQRGPVSGH